jgi:hypothetical protein
MSRRSEGLFAGSGISWRTVAITLLVIVVAFGLGIAAGWGTGLVPDIYRSATAPSPSPTPTPSPSSTVVVSVPPLDPIERELTADDEAAGVTTVQYTRQGEGTFTPAPGEDPIPTDGAPARLVRIDVEDGLDIDATAFGASVMKTLNDPRGWGSEGRLQFVQTQGVPDLRIVLASPVTSAQLCPKPHSKGKGTAATVEATTDEAEPSVTPSSEPATATCADRGAAAISEYDWIAGLPGYGDDIVGARQYLITHATGHILGEAEGKCVRGQALVMANQREKMDECEVNPWAFPDAPVPSPSPSTDPSATS